MDLDVWVRQLLWATRLDHAVDELDSQGQDPCPPVAVELQACVPSSHRGKGIEQNRQVLDPRAGHEVHGFQFFPTPPIKE